MSERLGVSYGKKPRADGRWQGYVVLSRNRRRTVIRRTEAEMRAEVDRLADQRDAGREPGTSDPMLTAYLTAWISQRRDGIIGKKPLAPSTAVRYEQLARVQIDPSIGTVRLSRFRVDHVDQVEEDLRHAGASGTVRLQVYRLLNVACKHAIRRGLMERNPCILADPPSRDAPKERDLDTEAIAAIFEAARGHPHEAMLWASIGTGMRQGEMFALRWADIDLGEERISIREKVQWIAGMGSVRSAPKTTAGIRSMTLPAVVVAALRAHKVEQERIGRPNPLGLVFPSATGTHFQASNWNKNVWAAWKEQAGVDPTTKWRTLTRKAHHSLMVSLGVDPETLRHRAGHTSATTTFDHYVMVVSSADREAAKKLDVALRKLAGPRQQGRRRSARRVSHSVS